MEFKEKYVYDNVIQVDEADSSRKYLAKVFTWMFVGLGISAAIALLIGPSILGIILNPATGGFSAMGYVVVFAPVALSMTIAFGFTRMPYPILLGIFIAYAVAIGVSLSTIGLIYTASSIFTVFVSAAVVFGIMAVAGYTTQQDLTKFGSILITIFWAAFVVSIVNFFLASDSIQYIISFVFVALMVGLTAYYMQMLKRIGAGLEYGSAESKKLVIIGAFVLYTTFINLFMSMLRIFGSRR
jgi:FtsH-binding integral membrane protein